MILEQILIAVALNFNFCGPVQFCFVWEENVLWEWEKGSKINCIFSSQPSPHNHWWQDEVLQSFSGSSSITSLHTLATIISFFIYYSVTIGSTEFATDLDYWNEMVIFESLLTTFESSISISIENRLEP